VLDYNLLPECLLSIYCQVSLEFILLWWELKEKTSSGWFDAKQEIRHFPIRVNVADANGCTKGGRHEKLCVCG
jgi:hypothetical protein